MLFCLFFFSSRRRHTRCALVTGVQTCALPISAPIGAALNLGAVGAQRRRRAQDILALQQAADHGFADRERAEYQRAVRDRFIAGNPDIAAQRPGGRRSEERRVGKEGVRTWRSRWSPYY